MTIKTLCYIHNLLIDAESKSELKAKWLYETYDQIASEYERGEARKVDYEAIKQQYDTARDEHNAARSARLDFECKEW